MDLLCCSRLLILIPLLFGCAVQAQDSFYATGVQVTDGDTICVFNVGDTECTVVRVAAIDAPEIDQPYGAAARGAMEALTRGRTLTIRPVDVDRYNRLVATVSLSDSYDLGYEMIIAGYAWHYDRQSSNQTPYWSGAYANGESLARRNRNGLWAQSQPIAPWEWREFQ